MMKKLITQSDAAIAEGWKFLDLPSTRAWYPVTTSQGGEQTFHSRRLPARYAALAAFVVAGSVAVLATFQRSMNHNA
jgi:hypothetical protein